MPSSRIPREIVHFTRRVNYASYSPRGYERNVRRIVPGYEPLHDAIVKEVRKAANRRKGKDLDCVELGVGTGVTASRVLEAVLSACVVGIDVNAHFARVAEAKLQRRFEGRGSIVVGEYSTVLRDWKPACVDVVYSAISVHHLTHAHKRQLFARVFRALRKGGVFVLGDLMDFEDASKNLAVSLAALRLLLANASSKKVGFEWADHWLNFNICATVEEQATWLQEAGFSSVKHVFERLTTNLLVARK
ncbi:class I SAM-dependent methyltransferase [Candidatus Micrarchaeota archaeon]|nr:class I SAM-dependent methyltransferase [Candidatus Micrarchaeota archaeon]